MFGLFGTPESRLISKIERNMMALESAANSGAWEAASMFASRQTQLLSQLQQVAPDDEIEARLAKHLTKTGLVRSCRDEPYRQWILEELEKRDLLPM